MLTDCLRDREQLERKAAVKDLPDAPFRSKAEAMASTDYAKVTPQMKQRWARDSDPAAAGSTRGAAPEILGPLARRPGRAE